MYASVIHLRDSATRRTLTSAPAGTVLASSMRLGWRGITVERHRLPGSEFPEHQVIGHQLSIHVGEPVDLELRLGGRWRTERRTSGAVDFVPHGALSVPRWRGSYEFIKLALDPPFVERALGAAGGRPVLVERRNVADPQVEWLARALVAELEGGNVGGPLFAESLGTALAAHLSGRYAEAPGPRTELGIGLTRWMVRRVAEYVDAHLAGDVSLAAMAGVLGLSPYHFARLFRRTVGVPPHQYVLQRRVERAKELLLAGGLDLSEVALAAGFSDQSHLTRVFRRAVGLTPARFRRAG